MVKNAEKKLLSNWSKQFLLKPVLLASLTPHIFEPFFAHCALPRRHLKASINSVQREFFVWDSGYLAANKFVNIVEQDRWNMQSPGKDRMENSEKNVTCHEFQSLNEVENWIPLLLLGLELNLTNFYAKPHLDLSDLLWGNIKVFWLRLHTWKSNNHEKTET